MYLSVQLPSAHIYADTRSAAPVGTTVRVTYASTATKFELLAVVLVMMLMIAVVLKIPFHPAFNPESCSGGKAGLISRSKVQTAFYI